MKLSVVDQSPVSAGFTAADALHNSIDLARLTERLGYERYWIAEHHGTGVYASPAPEILMTRVAAETNTIRVGSGAVLLPHYAPLKVVEVFRMMHALYPNRIDLGIGRAPGSSQLEAYALQRDYRTQKQAMADDFPERLAELLAFLHDAWPEQHPFGRIQVTPAMPGAPEVWLLGSSTWSAQAAAELGLPYAFAHFIGPGATRVALDMYHERVTPVEGTLAGQTILSLGVICADTQAEAERLYASLRLLRSLRTTGYRGPLPSPEEALDRLAGSTEDAARGDGEWPRYVVGDKAQVYERLMTIGTELRVDEIMAITVVHDHQARRRSYELLAEAFELEPRATAVPAK